MSSIRHINKIEPEFFYDTAIVIGKTEMSEIQDIARVIVQQNIFPYMDYHTMQGWIWMMALQEFLLRRGQKLHFKVEKS